MSPRRSTSHDEWCMCIGCWSTRVGMTTQEAAQSDLIESARRLLMLEHGLNFECRCVVCLPVHVIREKYL